MTQTNTNVTYRKDYQTPHFFIDTVTLNFKLDATHTLVKNTMTVRRNPEHPGQPLVLQGERLKLSNVRINGGKLNISDYRVSDTELIITPVPDEFTIQLQTEINPTENTALEGLYLSSGNFCTQCEAEGFRKITYYLDRPDVLATFTTRIEADKTTYPVLLSNGNCIEKGELDNNRHYAVWEDPFKKPAYLFALVAGDLVCHEDTYTTASGRSVDLKIYVEAENRDKTDHAMNSLKQSMKWDEDTYGLEYDLDIYMIVAVNDFNMGAMENKGLNVFNSKFVLARPDTATDDDYEHIQGVIGHEYFHNWTGNRVTCRDWFQLSLKEGLTVFRDEQFTADHTSEAVKRISDVNILRSHQFAEDSGPMAHPVRPDSYIEMNNFYTVTVYNKGAEVVRMYHTLLGANGFRKGMDLYFQRHDGQAVTCDDFRAAMADANGVDMTQFERWYSQAGTPKLSISGTYNETNKTFDLCVKQSCPATPGQPEKEPFLIPLRMALLGDKGQALPLRIADDTDAPTERVLQITEAEQHFQFVQVDHPPTPSLLRGFSAPVRLEYDYSDQDLCFLMGNDQDAFCRWEASQSLAARIIHQNDVHADNPTVIAYTQACKATLEATDLEPSLKSLTLTLPSEQELIDQCQQADVDQIVTARNALRTVLATELQSLWSSNYETLIDNGPYQNDAESVGKRRLKNLALQYLSLCSGEHAEQRVAQQFTDATNMTDSLAALACASHTQWSTREHALTQFYERWQNDPLVLDKWFSIQAMARRDNILDDVKNLMEHPKFNLKNPNRARSLIGAFAGNVLGFHQKDGAGYRFLADQIIALNQLNPQIAARLCVPLSRWRKFDAARQTLIKAELERIMAIPDLSKDVYEMVSKSINAEK